MDQLCLMLLMMLLGAVMRRWRETSEILGQQLQLRDGDGTVRRARGWRGSTPRARATQANPNCCWEHALWNWWCNFNPYKKYNLKKIICYTLVFLNYFIVWLTPFIYRPLILTLVFFFKRGIGVVVCRESAVASQSRNYAIKAMNSSWGSNSQCCTLLCVEASAVCEW